MKKQIRDEHELARDVSEWYCTGPNLRRSTSILCCLCGEYPVPFPLYLAVSSCIQSRVLEGGDVDRQLLGDLALRLGDRLDLVLLSPRVPIRHRIEVPRRGVLMYNQGFRV